MLRGCEEVVGAVRLLSGPPGVLNPCLIAKVVFRRLNIPLYFWGGQIVFWGGQIVFWGGQIVFWGGRDAHPTRKFNDCGTGILPVLKRRLYFGAGETPTPQENLVIVEQASCLFLKMVKDV